MGRESGKRTQSKGVAGRQTRLKSRKKGTSGGRGGAERRSLPGAKRERRSPCLNRAGRAPSQGQSGGIRASRQQRRMKHRRRNVRERSGPGGVAGLEDEDTLA